MWAKCETYKYFLMKASTCQEKEELSHNMCCLLGYVIPPSYFSSLFLILSLSASSSFSLPLTLSLFLLLFLSPSYSFWLVNLEFVLL
jgi:hypothetical protein